MKRDSKKMNCQKMRKKTFTLEVTGSDLVTLVNALSLLLDLEPEELPMCDRCQNDAETLLQSLAFMVESELKENKIIN